MSRPSFFSFLDEYSRRNGSLLCVGLDPPLEGIPASDIYARNKNIVDETCPIACAFKPNIAFYEARGAEGMEALLLTIRHIRAKGLPVILDAKRGDISTTAEAYARACFDILGADAVTVSPFLGRDSLEGFVTREDRGLFILCHTTNPGARDIQELDAGGEPLYLRIASLARQWNNRGNIGLVAGATFPEPLARIRGVAPEMWMLLPGVGAQGGDLAASLAAGLDEDGGRVLVSVSRAIWQAREPGAEAKDLRDRINSARNAARREVVRGHTNGSSRASPMPSTPPKAPGTPHLLEEVALGLHDIGAVNFGRFTLKSGQSSPIYIDLRLLVSNPGLMRAVANAIAGLLSGLRFDRIAAIPYGGLPIGQAVSLVTGKPLIYPRREAKDYGTKKLIEGAYTAGDTVVVLDDLITTGQSKLEAIAPLQEAGLKVKDVVVLVDRGQGGKEELAEKGLALHSALTLGVILDVLSRKGRISDEVRSNVRASLGIT